MDEKAKRLGLRGTLLLCLPAAAMVWTDDFPADEQVEIAVKVVTLVAVLAMLGLSSLPSSRRKSGRSEALLKLAGFLAIATYFNFGAFHGQSYVHYWEQFHYVLGAKYFPELGYDGLYAASLEAQLVSHPASPLPRFVRDLRDNRIKSSYRRELLEHRAEVKARFSPRRWQTFVSDHGHFLRANRLEYLAAIRRDHGFNPTPSWTFVARLFAGWPAIDTETLEQLAHLDLMLLAWMVWAVRRTYGSRVAGWAVVLFGLNYAGRYYWIGGAFLREDWLVALVGGICLLEARRYRYAGLLIGYAAMVRIFPVLFLFGPVVVALRHGLQRRSLAWAKELAGGFLLAVLVLSIGGAATGRGVSAWLEFGRSINLHRGTWLTNNVGLDNVILYDTATFGRERVDFRLPEPWIHWQKHMDERKADRQELLVAAKLVWMALLAVACWRASVSEAAIFSMVAVFALTLTTNYYWQMLVLIALLRRLSWVLAVLILSLGMMGLHFLTPAFELRYGALSWGLVLLFLAILGRRAWHVVVNRSTSPTGAPEGLFSQFPVRWVTTWCRRWVGR